LQDFPYAAESDREVLDESFETTGAVLKGIPKLSIGECELGDVPPFLMIFEDGFES
jgi:hypothetical protein